MTFAELKVAADKGNSAAQFEIGRRFADGNGILKDSSEAIAWWRKAAAQGYPPAEYDLGVAYGRGDGVPKDKQQALRWCRLAAGSGLPDAQVALGVFYSNGSGGLTQDQAQAFRWFKAAADQGYPPAQYYLAICFRDGKGIPVDSTEAIAWLQRAASNGVANAQVELGKHYSEAGLAQISQITNTQTQINIDTVRELIATNQNLIQASRWFCKAANQNYHYGQAYLGAAFMVGEGMEKDPIEAYKWLSLTMTNEHDFGRLTIEFMQSRGMTFTPEQIFAGKLRAEEFSKTNHIIPKSVPEVPGL